MPLIQDLKPWLVQPQYPALIDAKYLQQLAYNASQFNRLGLSQAVGNAGVGLSIPGANNTTGYVDALTNQGPSGASSPFTIEVICSLTAAPSLSNLFTYGQPLNTAISGARRGLIFYTGAPLKIYFWGESADVASTLNVDVTGQYQHILVTWPGSGSTIYFYQRVGNNIQYQSATLSGTLNATVNNTSYLCGRHPSGTLEPTGIIYNRSIHNKFLSQGEALARLANPWELYEPINDDIYVSLLTSPVFDSASSSAYQASVASYSWNHIVGTQPNRVLEVSVSLFLAGSVSSITYGGVALTKNASATIINGAYRSEVWQLIAPASGTGSIVVTLNAAITSIGSAESYYNVDQTSPTEATATASGTGTPAAVSVTTVAANSLVLANLAASSASGITSAGGQINRSSNSGALGSDRDDEKGPVVTPASTTVTWNGLGTLDTWAASAISLRLPQALLAISTSVTNNANSSALLNISTALASNTKSQASASANLSFVTLLSTLTANTASSNILLAISTPLITGTSNQASSNDVLNIATPLITLTSNTASSSANLSGLGAAVLSTLTSNSAVSSASLNITSLLNVLSVNNATSSTSLNIAPVLSTFTPDGALSSGALNVGIQPATLTSNTASSSANLSGLGAAVLSTLTSNAANSYAAMTGTIALNVLNINNASSSANLSGLGAAVLSTLTSNNATSNLLFNYTNTLTFGIATFGTPTDSTKVLASLSITSLLSTLTSNQAVSSASLSMVTLTSNQAVSSASLNITALLSTLTSNSSFYQTTLNIAPVLSTFTSDQAVSSASLNIAPVLITLTSNSPFYQTTLNIAPVLSTFTSNAANSYAATSGTIALNVLNINNASSSASLNITALLSTLTSNAANSYAAMTVTALLQSITSNQASSNLLFNYTNYLALQSGGGINNRYKSANFNRKKRIIIRTKINSLI